MSTNQKVSGSILSFSKVHVNVSVVKILNPNLPAKHSMKCERQVLKQLLGVEIGL